MSLLNQLRISARNALGYSTKRKIIVIESDDWGGIRMPSRPAYESLRKNELNLSGASHRFNRYDTLADKNDLTLLFEALSSFRDGRGNHPVITALTVVANPDFIKIRESEFNDYHYEPFTKTLERYYGSNTPFPLWHEGIQNRLFLPQFHGREHLNVAVWMDALKQNDLEARIAFEEGCWGFNNKHKYGISYQSAFDLESIDQLHFQAQIIKDGLKIFEQLFGYRASYFVPPNGPFNNRLEKYAAESGIKFMSSSKIQLEPHGNGKTKKRFHYLGQKNQYGQYYITRNCFFEPSGYNEKYVDNCMLDIDIAFKYHKPAVISSHRVNYIGALHLSNRTQGLEQLRLLLATILKKWPDVEFMSSVDLGELMC